MPRGTFSGPTGMIALTAIALLALMQSPAAALAVLLGFVTVIVTLLLAGWRLLAAAHRGLPWLPRVRTHLVLVAAVLLGILAGGLVFRVRVDAAKSRAEHIAELLDHARAQNGRYPLSLVELPDAPRLPGFAEDGFYSTSEYRDAFTLQLTIRTGGPPSWWVYNSASRAWTFVD